MQLASPPRIMPFPVAEHTQRTFDLSCAEHGALRLLYDAYWLNGGPLADDDKLLSRITRTFNGPEQTAAKFGLESWPKIRKTVIGFFKVHAGTWQCGWLDEALTTIAARRRRQSAAAGNTNFHRWSLEGKKAANVPQNATGGSESLTESLTESDAVEAFARFWAEWPSHERKSGKEKAFRAFCRAIIKDGCRFEDIMEGLKRCKEGIQWNKDDGQYIPFPTTWLNRKDWQAFDGGGRHGAVADDGGPRLAINGQSYSLTRGPARSEFATGEAHAAALKTWTLWKMRH